MRGRIDPPENEALDFLGCPDTIVAWLVEGEGAWRPDMSPPGPKPDPETRCIPGWCCLLLDSLGVNWGRPLLLALEDARSNELLRMGGKAEDVAAAPPTRAVDSIEAISATLWDSWLWPLLTWNISKDS